MINIFAVFSNFFSAGFRISINNGIEREDIWIATYGTLKKGYNNYRLYLTESTFVGSGLTEDKYPLIIKDMPYLIEELGAGFQVEVDVYKVSKQVLRKLDELEMHPTWYRRKQIPILINGIKRTCWIYFSMTESIGNNTVYQTYKQLAGNHDLDGSFPRLESTPVFQSGELASDKG